MKHSKKDCGCYISSIGHMKSIIEFCSIHAAAPELLEVLEDMVKYNGCSDPMTLKAKQAINKAKAKATK